MTRASPTNRLPMPLPLRAPRPRMPGAARLVLLAVALPAFWTQVATVSAQESANGSLLERARQARERGDSDRALELVTQAVRNDPADVRARLMRASIYDALRRHREAVVDYDAILQAVPDSARVHYLRGRSRFKAADMAGSLEDFDRAVRLDPTLDQRLWERGISHYYARKYAAGARQFEEYQTVDASDVENVVWRYLCQSRAEGVESARRKILPLDREDHRVPMMTIYALYRGEATPDDVLATARRGDPGDVELRHRLFYAHLYVGLYFEAQSDAESAKRHLKLAHEQEISHYMWDVVCVHLAERGWMGGEERPMGDPGS